jgi:hypothetical protein
VARTSRSSDPHSFVWARSPAVLSNVLSWFFLSSSMADAGIIPQNTCSPPPLLCTSLLVYYSVIMLPLDAVYCDVLSVLSRYSFVNAYTVSASEVSCRRKETCELIVL